ncbi:hypothetical protein C7S14_1979 [Burkholderia cepacia]|nr:hypothetical protein C7S14_1979 [Burkholderia cepacia]
MFVSYLPLADFTTQRVSAESSPSAIAADAYAYAHARRTRV